MNKNRQKLQSLIKDGSTPRHLVLKTDSEVIVSWSEISNNGVPDMNS